MGKFIGIGRSATTNCVSIILMLTMGCMLIMGMFDFFSDGDSNFSNYSDIFMPIVTTIIGFLIGQKASSD